MTLQGWGRVGISVACEKSLKERAGSREKVTSCTYEFVIENVNIPDLENKLVNTRSLDIAKNTCTKHKSEENISQIGSFDDLSDFRLD